MSGSDRPRGAAIVGRSMTPDRQPEEEQPRWRRDFPVDWSEDDYVSRRDLTKYVVLTSCALAAGQTMIAGRVLLGKTTNDYPRSAIASVGELPIGGAKTFDYPAGSTPRLLVRTGEASFVAYDQQCTHLQCPVVPAVEQGKLHCPCHNGWFDLQTGTPLAGPPRRRLPRVVLEVHDSTVYATGIEDSAT